MFERFKQGHLPGPENVKLSVSEKEPPIRIWGEVTDPKKHDPQNFRYLVHAFNPFAAASQGIIAASAELYDKSGKVDKLRGGNQSINLFDSPEKLRERVSLSMSLVDHEHTSTWGAGGLIIESPEENIAIISPTDAGSISSNRELLKKQGQKQQLLTGEKLLKSTSGVIYNEVVAFTKSESGETVRLKGFFIKVDKRGQEVDSVVAKKMREHAERLGLPLIEIQVNGPYEKEKFKMSENNILANYGGNRYNLGSEDQRFAFHAYNDKNEVFFPDSKEINEVLSHFLGNGSITSEQAQQIKKRYEITDKRRKSPEVERDPKTQEISRITFHDGYGKDEIEYWLGSSGYCFRVNIEKFKEALKEAALSPRKPEKNAFTFLRYQTPLSGSEVLSFLKSREEIIDQQEYKNLMNLFSGIKDKIDQAYETFVPYF